MDLKINMIAEKILIQIDDKIVELKSAEKEAFINQRKVDLQKEEQMILKQQNLKDNKISAYKKLGLTDEEIGAILL